MVKSSLSPLLTTMIQDLGLEMPQPPVSVMGRGELSSVFL
ncbi:Uncharacterised protein [Cedecea neteri]|uniref:Uncharacterized protein n=1 Tax=Cedecea neteri TaxID=158822 RepID=A0A2X3IET0_9ENTR|nr:Uncharacterised protein [Cedecea neteri]